MTAIDYTARWHLGRDRDVHEAEVTIPIRTKSEANMREHWAPKAKRAKQQRQLSAWACGGPLAEYRKALAAKRVSRIVLRLTRIAPRQLDDDNLRGALKAIRDGVTDALGLPCDRDERLTWVYLQDRGDVGQYAVRIRVRTEAA